MKRILLFTFFLIAFSARVWAQETKRDSVLTARPARNAVYIEYCGNALFASLNYERLIYLPNNAPTLALRAGVLPMANRENSNTRYLHLVLPLELTLIPSKKNVSPELGAGLTLKYTYTKNKLEANEMEQELFPVMRAGVRWGGQKSRFFGRAGLLLFFLGNGEDFQKGATWPWIGFSLGYRFGKR